jgi:ATP-dependent DNA helicase RecQ
VPAEAPRRARANSGSAAPRPDRAVAALTLDAAGLARFGKLKAWRTDVAREHKLPPYVVFHDATLAQMARDCPATLADMAGISGVGAKKLEAYGSAILRVLEESGA